MHEDENTARLSAEARACDVEPIRVPGAIQPHGALVALDARDLLVSQVSANSARFFGVAPADALGRPLSALVGAASGPLLAALEAAGPPTDVPVLVEIDGRSFDAHARRGDGVAILDFEPHDRAASASDALLRRALARLQRPTIASDVCAIAVDEIRKLTGFDRVLLYRFDDEGHGDVLEEARADDVDAYRNLRFPADDIPRQARELYVLNWLRLIPDATYAPVPLVPERRPDTGEPLDLSFSTLRSVSPVHLEYLRNMGVRASMSVSLVRDGALWGLIACHHRSARHVGSATRAACEVIGRVVSLQVAALEEIEARTLRAALRGVEATLVDAMRAAPDEPVKGLVHAGDALLELVGATGAAICTGPHVRVVGVTPPVDRIADLVAWLGDAGGAGVFHTGALAEVHAPAAEYASVASGLLALVLPGLAPSYVLWFRPEIVRTVTWAGDPTKVVVLGADGARYHPRLSFEAWKQVVRARSAPWRVAEVDAAAGLRRHAIELDLVKQMHRFEQAVRHRDEMVAVLSHDLKNPLSVMKPSAALLRAPVAGNASAVGVVSVLERTVDRMTSLVMNLLDLARIEGGRFDLAPQSYAASRLVSDAFLILAPLAESRGVRLGYREGSDAWVQADAERVFQVLSNLVGNAIKFTPGGGAVDVAVDAPAEEGAVRFAVRDTGPGILAADLEHIFDRYWQSRRVRSAGAGLGLYIAKGIVEAHGGRLWARSTVGEGATFFFTLPAAVPGSLRPPPHGPCAVQPPDVG